MLESTFQLVPGLGPVRERRMWRAGVTCWGDLEEALPAPVLSRGKAAPLRAAVADAAAALDRGDVSRLAAALPAAERWRLFAAFGAAAAYLDIETSDDVWGQQNISAIGFLDRDGPRLLLAGRDLHRFPELARDWEMLVTFNGSSFDVPVLRRAFPGSPSCRRPYRSAAACRH